MKMHYAIFMLLQKARWAGKILKRQTALPMINSSVLVLVHNG